MNSRIHKRNYTQMHNHCNDLRRREERTKLLHGTHLPNFPVNYSNEYMVGNWTNNHVKFTKTAPDVCAVLVI